MNRPAFFRSALAILLCLTMVLSFVPMQAMAEDAEPIAVHDCAKDGHDYKAGEFRATCKQYPRTHYTCSFCGDSYDVYPEELYSDWQTEKPDVDESLIQSKTQYRTSEYETVTSFNTALDGYEQIGSQWSVVEKRTVSYVANWPTGFDRTNSLFTKYDKIAMKVTAYESSNRKTEVESDAIAGYLYYHWCCENYPYTVDTQDGLYNRFHAYYSTKAPSGADSNDPSDNSYRFDDATACPDSKWYFYVPVYDQTYTNYRREYIYGTWGNFSEWSDTEVTPSETLKVGTRTVYRYVNAPMADHIYDSVTTPASCATPGQTVYTCSVCGYSYTQELPQTGHSFVSGKCTVCDQAEPNYYLFGYINGANYGCEEDYENMGAYQFVNGTLVATFESDSYIAVKTEGNTAWYMTEAYVTEDTATLKNTNTGAAEKMFVPGGVELTFTLTYGEDNSLILSYVGGQCIHRYEETVLTAPTCTEGGQAKYLCAKCGDSYTKDLEAKGHDYRRGTCKNCGLVDESYVTPNYYLVGYINGVDYGSVDDFENRGEFRFEEGKLVINCTQDSYVFVKTEGNTAWYMTSEYCTDTTAVLYDTRDGAMEKMYIPPYMEVTFTLQETENNSLTLSYVAVPCKHIYDDTVSVAPDCKNDGIMLRTCRICTATAEKPIVASGHNYEKVVTEPGCITAGYTTYTCTGCGDSYVDDEVAATGHDYESEVTAEPGCLITGSMTYTCKTCGHSYTGKIEAIGHEYKSVVTKPTCTEKGYTTYTCDGCGDSYVEDVVAATGHHYQSVTTLKPTCVSDGLMTYTCSDCGDAYLQTMEAMGHNYISEVTKPTCTDKGYTTHTCTICGYTYVDTPVNATGHKFVSGKCSVCGESDGPAYFLFGYINGANYACEEDYENMGNYRFKNGQLVATFEIDSYIGIKKEGNAAWYMTDKYVDTTTGTFKNTSTGAGEKMFVPSGVEVTFILTVGANDTLTLSYTTTPCSHAYYVTVTTQPTCEKSGVKTYTCNKCGASHTESMDPTGHSYKAVVTKPTCLTQGITTYTCLICQESYTDQIVAATGHAMKAEITVKPGCETSGTVTYSCKNCDYSYTKKVEATGHDYKGVVTKPGCDTVGYTVYTCTDCGDNYRADEVAAIGHDYSAKVTLEPTCDVPGTTTYTCATCGNIYTEEIEPTGHNFVEGKCATCGKSEICEHSWVDGICSLCGAACEHEYVYGICSKCSGVDPFYVPSYYLIGHINGVDYGCNDDYENMGDYKFEDNKLTVTFTQDSYVFLKAEGNTSWYMTKAYSEEATATFYNTVTGAAEKMFVPGNVELTFTLTVNSDDTLTLTYSEAVCDHSYKITDSADATCTEAGSITYTCSKCSDSYTNTVPAIGHSFAEGICGNCGAKDPDYKPEGAGYVRVTSLSQITAGGQFVLVAQNGDTYQAMDTTIASGKFVGVDVTVSGDQVAGSSLPVWTVEPVEGGIAIRVGSSYLAYNTSTNFKMQDTAYTWTVEDGFLFTASTATRGIYYQISTDKFGAYAVSNANNSGYVSGLQLYRYEAELPECNHSWVNGVCGICGEKQPDYYLIGHINGIDHGCNDDYENMGDYKFVDGKLVATFTQDSYVFLKSEGNADWYMAQAYSDGTTAIFYNTETGAAEKLFVPGGVEITFTLTVNSNDTLTLSYTTAASVVPTLTLKSPTLEFKDMICINAFYTAENTQDVVEMGMITYSFNSAVISVETAEHIIPGYSYIESTGRYVSASQGIHAKYLGDTVYLAIYAKLADGTYAYSKLAPYSPVTYANNQLKNSTDTKLKQLVVAMLNYGAEAQKFFGHNVTTLANASLTDAQKQLPEAYRADMVTAVPAASAAKQGVFANNKGFAKRTPSISFEGAFCINYFFTPNYAPVDGITMYYWNEADFKAASVLTAENATGSFKMNGSGVGQYNGSIEGIAAKALSEAVYVSAVYSDGTTTWTSGVLGYSIGSYCSSQASKGAAVSELAMATAVYGYHAKQFFG